MNLGERYQDKRWRALSEVLPEGDGRELGVAIVTADLLGLVKNGGIGTANYHLARALKSAGHEVTLIYYAPDGGAPSEEESEAARRLYENEGLKLEIIAPPYGDIGGEVGSASAVKEIYPNHSYVRMSYRVYLYLRDRGFDVVIFHDWLGIGYYSTLAKHTGVAFAETALVVQCHSPELWVTVNNRTVIGEKWFALTTFQMERGAVELADAVTAPTHYLLTWMEAFGFQFPERVGVLPLAYADDAGADAESDESRERAGVKVREIVFFGRLEQRKGLGLFCRALTRLAKVAPGVGDGIAVTFLGKVGRCGGMDAETYIEGFRKGSGFSVRVVGDLDAFGAIDYLKQPGRLAVIASLADNSPLTVIECAYNEIPFLATNVGGIPELVSDRRNLFDPDPDALARKLREVLGETTVPAGEPALTEGERNATCAAAISQLGVLGRSGGAKPSGEPKVSVCVINHNNQHFLRVAVGGILEQTYSNFEVILVDDGSTDPETLEYLSELEGEFEARGWTLVRQENRFVGRARNHAASLASGEFLVFMDNDNYAFPHQVETFVKAILSSGADAVTCPCVEFRSGMDEGDVPSPASDSVNHLWVPLGASRSASLYGNTYGDANAIFRKEAFDAIGGFTEDYGMSWEDYEILARLDHSGFKVTLVPEPLFMLRFVEGSVSRTTDDGDNRFRGFRPVTENLPWDSYGDLVYLNMLDTVIGGEGMGYHLRKATGAFLRKFRGGARAARWAASAWGRLRGAGR